MDCALVGTGRQADRVPSALESGLPVDDVLEKLDPALPVESRVLLVAAARDTYERAGTELTSDAEPLPAAAAESLPLCAPAVTVLLAELLQSAPTLLLKEALARLAAAGQIVSPGLLPELLNTREESLAGVLPRVMGERGRWLAALSESGDWLTQSAPETEEAALATWQEGRHAQRLAVLGERRRLAPAQAREWLAATWAQEKGEHRLELLAALESNLDAADTPFLEQALSDRSAQVRAAAARLLSRLPESGTARRVTERADALLSYEAPKNRSGLWSRVKSAVGAAPTGTLAVSPPTSFDTAWEKDGIAARPPKGVGERAHWLTEMLALVSPPHWEQRFEAPADELIRAALATEWAHAILLGWSRAVLAHPAEAWAATLWEAWREIQLDEALKYETGARRRMLELLLGRMSRADAEARVLELAGTPLPETPLDLATLVEVVPEPWSADYGRRLLKRLQPQLATAAAVSWMPGTWFDVLPRIAGRLPPETFPDARDLEQGLSAIDTLTPAYQRRLEELQQTVALRQRIHEEIRT